MTVMRTVEQEAGRAIAKIRSTIGLGDLGERGWSADDLGPDLLMPFRDFSSLDEAKAAAAQDLPLLTPVSWSSNTGRQTGGFVVGHHELGPGVQGVTPAVLLWPDGSEQYVVTDDELASTVTAGLTELTALARAAGFVEQEVLAGQQAAATALDEFAAGGPLTIACLGPIHDVRCAVTVEPVAKLRWTGFREGWTSPTGEPSRHRHHPVHGARDGELQRVWRSGLDEGMTAARRHKA
jgi:hypothetical protein